jgi:hypothetical protein
LFTKKAEKRIQPAPWAALALCAALVMWVLFLAASPEAARAQAPDGARATGAADVAQRGAAERAVVVGPGDSLWSISAERLGPNASPRRVMKGVERIHALNRASIGADPATIFAGQQLALPRGMAERGTAGGPPPEPKAEPKAGLPADRGAVRGAGVAEDRTARPEPTGVAGAEASGASDERRTADHRSVGRTAERAAPDEPARLPPGPADAGPIPEAAQVAQGGQDVTPDGPPPSPLVQLLREAGSAFSFAGVALSGALSGAYLAAGAWDPSRLGGAALLGLGCLFACVLLRTVAREAYGRLTTAGAYGGSSYYVSRLPIPVQAPPPAIGGRGGSSAGDVPDRDGPEGARTGARGRGVPTPRPRRATAAGSARPTGTSPGRTRAKRAAGEARIGRAVPSGLATGTHNLEVRRSLKRGLAARSGTGPRAGRGPRWHPRRRAGPGAPPKVGAAV